jgi:NADPH:quinone reductase-like Zn-dependent oxidoreductase
MTQHHVLSAPSATFAGGQTMRAVVQERYGPSPEQVLRLAEIARPSIAADQVLVRVQAASVDRGTWHIMSGLPYPIRLAGFGLRRPTYANPGRSLAGTVEAVGADVSGLAPGDEVYGIGDATFAEYAAARPDTLARKPVGLPFGQAAALPVSGLTALQAVRNHGRVRAGQTVLVLGASGGVGSFAVQIARAFGAVVTGTASTAKTDMVHALGATTVLDHSREDFSDGGRRYDVVLDIGGNAHLTRLRRALTPHGRLVIVGGETDGRLLGGSSRQVRAALLNPFVGPHLGTFLASENAADLTTLAEFVEAGAVVPVIERTYPLGQVAAAVRHLLDGQARGKLVVSMPTGTTHSPGSGRTT